MTSELVVISAALDDSYRKVIKAIKWSAKIEKEAERNSSRGKISRTSLDTTSRYLHAVVNPLAR